MTDLHNVAVCHPYFIRKGVGVLSRATLDLPVAEPMKRATASTPAAQNGLRYERKVIDALRRRADTRLVPGPTFRFAELRGRAGKIIPDALLFSSDWASVAVIEIKLRHSGDPWHQLYAVYIPIVRKALRSFNVVPLEICCFYDPFIKLPRPVSFLKEPDDVFAVRTEAFHPVLIKGSKEWMDG